MTYFITPVLGLTLPNPGTGQTFETPVVNNDFVLLENGIAADRNRLGVLEGKTVLRSTAAVFQVATTGNLPSSGVIAGDLAVVASNKGLYAYNGTSWRSASGLIPIKATGGGGGGGGTATQNGSGKWFITNCTFVNVDGVFSGEFDNYVMVLSIFSSSVATLVSFVFRSAAVDTITGYSYGTQDINFSASTTTSGYSTAAANIPLARSNGASGGDLRADIAHPWRGNAKYVIAHGVDSAIKREIGATQQSATFFDGFTLNAIPATFSGEMTIFGVTNPF